MRMSSGAKISGEKMLEQDNADSGNRRKGFRARFMQAFLGTALTGAIAFAGAAALAAQQAPVPNPQAPPPGAPGTDKAPKGAETRITPEQAKQLFALVDQLMQFS